MVKSECFLRSCEGRHPDILLADGGSVQVGRGPVTKIKDARCSRVQVVLVANLSAHTVVCRQMGGNPSTFVQGQILRVGSSCVLRHMDRLELLTGQYAYTVVFNPPPSKQPTVSSSDCCPALTTDNKKESKVTALVYTDRLTQKRKASCDAGSVDESSNQEKRPTTVRLHLEAPWFKPDQGKVIRSKDGIEWLEACEGKVLVMRTPGCKDSDKIAAFDLDGTIITTSSGKVFPINKDDWKILLPEVPGKLKALHSANYKLVIITNQAGIARGKLAVGDFIDKAESIASRLGTPLHLICSTSDVGFYRKPRPGIWHWLEQVGNSAIPIDLNESFYCGDAAGRELHWTAGRKKDFSCSDRLFALNLNLKFFTPEELFQQMKPTKKYLLPEFNPNGEMCQSLVETELEQFTSLNQEMIILVGIQGAGKSHVAANLESKGYVVASNDRCGGKDKCLRVAREAVKAGRRVVVDNTHRDRDSRKDYIELARSNHVPVRCFIMTTSHHHARHNNMYRELTDSSHARIKEPLFNSYRSKFEEPTLSEGFASIVRVNFVPTFPSSAHHQLYKLYLLEK